MMRIIPVPTRYTNLSVAKILDDYHKSKDTSLGDHPGFRTAGQAALSWPVLLLSFIFLNFFFLWKHQFVVWRRRTTELSAASTFQILSNTRGQWALRWKLKPWRSSTAAPPCCLTSGYSQQHIVTNRRQVVSYIIIENELQKIIQKYEELLLKTSRIRESFGIWAAQLYQAQSFGVLR